MSRSRSCRVPTTRSSRPRSSAPALTIDKDGALADTNGNGVADVGETITYEFLVTNTGNTTLLGVNVVDDQVAGILPAPVDLIPGGTQNFPVRALPCHAGRCRRRRDREHRVRTRGQVPNGPEAFSPEDEHVEPVAESGPRRSSLREDRRSCRT